MKSNKQLDEMQESKLLKIQEKGFWLVFWILFAGIFVLLDAGGLSPAKDKRAKSTEKTYLSDVCALVNRRLA